jgi:hypothetical protein
VRLVRVRGKEVPGADLIDAITDFADVQVTMKRGRAEGVY